MPVTVTKYTVKCGYIASVVVLVTSSLSILDELNQMNFDRLNTNMRDRVDAVLAKLADIGKHQAAAGLLRAGVPLRVIGRVLDAQGRRRTSVLLGEFLAYRPHLLHARAFVQLLAEHIAEERARAEQVLIRPSCDRSQPGDFPQQCLDVAGSRVVAALGNLVQLLFRQRWAGEVAHGGPLLYAHPV